MILRTGRKPWCAQALRKHGRLREGYSAMSSLKNGMNATIPRCSNVFGSATTKAWATRLSGRSCVGPTEFTASWYLPGDHALPHSDEGPSAENNNRQVAFVWHLAKDWRSEWGGALFWCRPSALVGQNELIA